MPREQAQREQAAKLLRKRGIMRLSELKDAGVHYQTVARMADDGSLQRIGRGLYQLPDADYTLAHSLAEAAKAVPRGVVCLLSALQFHELTLQMPSQVWIAIDRKAWVPRLQYPPVRIVRFGEKAMAIGIERQIVDKVETRIFDPAKTIVDCFRYRKVVGLDVALESLRNSIRRKRSSGGWIEAIRSGESGTDSTRFCSSRPWAAGYLSKTSVTFSIACRAPR